MVFLVGRVAFTVVVAWILPIFKLVVVANNVTSKRDFITVENGSFFKSCSRHYLVSMNYWSAMNLAADDTAGGNLTRFEIEVKRLAEMGVNNVRIMAALEASGHPPYRIYPALMYAPGKYNEEMFVGLDRALVEFSRYNISVVMTLNNFWDWSGGYAQYVSWATNNSQVPPTSPWDPSLNPPYGNWSTSGIYGKYDPATGNWDGFVGYAGRFYNDSSITNLTQTWFKNHIHTVVHRQNTISGVVYKEDPTIMTWELTNEPQDPPVKWVEDTSTYIKSIAPNHLVTVGFEGKNGEWWFKRVHAPRSVDYTCGHLWVQNWGVYDPLDPTEKSLKAAKIFANGYLKDLSKWTLDLKKPLVLEEFGMARDNWLNVNRGAPKTHYLYEPWAYGGTWRPSDSRDHFNQDWSGDPPHEPPGWYDLYDTDPTIKIIHQQAQNVSRIIDSLSKTSSHLPHGCRS
ncbi:hypothetical protein PGTUg99_017389 [Puccinia graminis f. sp. tritici]|uniref:mannan endo-1,4-beta-mannosidase n=2 Tax=Puccinia graminis f. sp. tritici TaxID=56615 RepID=A0A5B0NI98_PUCGR|nr:hypothetical protein PGTUg99_017389 [Puccinia graminis f. sp. tritici]